MNKQINKLVDIKLKISKLMEEKKQLEIKIENNIKKMGLKQVKTDKATASISKRKSIKIISEEEVIKQLEEMKLKNDYVYEQLDKKRYDVFAKEMIKAGKELKGIEETETEYLSVRIS